LANNNIRISNNIKKFAAATLFAASVASITACSSGSSNNSNDRGNNVNNLGAVTTGDLETGAVTYNIPAATQKNAAQLLARATFGTTRADIDAVMQDGLELWVDKQFTLKGPSHLDYVQRYSNGSGRYPRHDFWWLQATLGIHSVTLNTVLRVTTTCCLKALLATTVIYLKTSP